MYSTWKMIDVKSELKRRGASITGSWAQLIKRLEDYDKEFEKTEYLEDEHTESLKLPPREFFTDITCDMKLPPITKTHIRHYLGYSQNKFKAAILLYESQYLVKASSAHFFNNTYIKAQCQKPILTREYGCDIILNVFGEPQESSCECPSNDSEKKTTCKHVAVTLLGVEQLANKNIILTSEGPLRLQQPNVPRQNKTQSAKIIFEPYPLKSINKEEYNKRIRNLVMNYPNSTMPIKQLYEMADQAAVKKQYKPRVKTCPNYRTP